MLSSPRGIPATRSFWSKMQTVVAKYDVPFRFRLEGVEASEFFNRIYDDLKNCCSREAQNLQWQLPAKVVAGGSIVDRPLKFRDQGYVCTETREQQGFYNFDFNGQLMTMWPNMDGEPILVFCGYLYSGQD
jgi:hypothetical protein